LLSPDRLLAKGERLSQFANFIFRELVARFVVDDVAVPFAFDGEINPTGFAEGGYASP
jgi:hypothetical protein